MAQLLQSLYDFLASPAINFWIPLAILAAPFLVFILKPERKNWQLALRLLIAGAATYMLFNLALGTSYNHSWNDYQECYASRTDLRDMSPERAAACHHHIENAVNDSTLMVMVLLGFIPAAGYVGIWELLWRVIYQGRFNGKTHSWQIRWFSNLTILSCAPLVFFVCLNLWIAVL